MSLRGQNARRMELADMLAYKLTKDDATCLVAILSSGKTNKFGKIEYGAALRHVDVKQCTVSMFGFYLFARFMIDNEAFPVFPKNEDWFTTKILKSSKGGMKQALSYNAHNTQVTDCFKACGVQFSNTTHAARGSSINMAADGVRLCLHVYLSFFIFFFLGCN